MTTQHSPLTTHQSPPRAVVLSFDRLPIWCLEAYGGPRAQTPALNRLAAQSAVFDRHFCECADHRVAGHAWWTGRYHFPRPADVQQPSVPAYQQLKAAGVKTTALLEAGQHDIALPVGFEEVRLTGEQHSQVSDDAFSTLCRLIQAGLHAMSQQVELSGPPWLMWMKAHGLAACTSASVETPQAAAAVAALDREIERWLHLLDVLAENGPVLFVLTAAMGALPTGLSDLRDELSGSRERSPLREPLVHTPLWISCRPGGLPGRVSALAQTVDLVPTLFDWFGVAPHQDCEGRSLLPAVCGSPQPGRTHICLGDARGSMYLHSDELALIVRPAEQPDPGEVVQLFAKPDDFWEVNDLADQSPGAVESLRDLLEQTIDRLGPPRPCSIDASAADANDAPARP